jgi:uncharacterized protein YcbK (DUF882 family)
MDRRRFLFGSAALLASAGARASSGLGGAVRRLRLMHGDSGERFDGPFRNESGYDMSALGELAHFMRDRHVERSVAVDPPLFDFLADVMAAMRLDEAVLLSGYRSLETNAKLAKTKFGVAENSHHIYGRAIDVYFSQRLADAAQYARDLERGGVGWYPDSKFIHLDTGAPRYWSLTGTSWRNWLKPGAIKRPLKIREQAMLRREYALRQCLEDRRRGIARRCTLPSR